MENQGTIDISIQSQTPNIFKIDHYYHFHRDKCKHAILVESTLTPEEMATIAGAMQLMFEDIQEEEDCIDGLHLLKLLETYFGVKNVKEKYLHVLKQTVLPDDKWDRIINIPILDGDKQYEIVQIDMYDARDFLCGKDYKNSFDCLPKSESFIADLKNMGNYYTRI